MALRGCLFASTSREYVNASGKRCLIRQQSSFSRHVMQKTLARPTDGPRDAFWAIQGRDEPKPDVIRPHPYNQVSPDRPMRRFFKNGKVDYPVEDHFPYVPPVDSPTWMLLQPPLISRMLGGPVVSRKEWWPRLRRRMAHIGASIVSRTLIRGILKAQTLVDARVPKPTFTDIRTLRIVRFLHFRYRRAMADLQKRLKGASWLRFIPASVRTTLLPAPSKGNGVDILAYKRWKEVALADIELQFDAYLRAFQSGLERDVQAFKTFEPSEAVLSDLRSIIAQRNAQRVTVEVLPIGKGSQPPEIVGYRCSPRAEAPDKEYAGKVEQYDQSPFSAQLCVRFQTRQILRAYPQEALPRIVQDPETGLTVTRRLSQATQDRHALDSVQSETRDVLQYFIFQRNFGSRSVIEDRYWYCVAETFESDLEGQTVDPSLPQLAQPATA